MQALIQRIREIEAQTEAQITTEEILAKEQIEVAQAQAAEIISRAKADYKGIFEAELHRAKLEAERERAMMHAQLEFSLDVVRHKAKENAEKAVNFVLSKLSNPAEVSQ